MEFLCFDYLIEMRVNNTAGRLFGIYCYGRFFAGTLEVLNKNL
jgi:hypothetical protein